MNEDFGVGRRPAKQPAHIPSQPKDGPRHRMQYASRTRDIAGSQAVSHTAKSSSNSNKATDNALGSLAAQSSKSINGPKPNATDPATSDGDLPNSSDDNDKTNQPAWYRRLAGKLSRKQWLILAAVLVLLIGGLVSFLLTRPSPAPSSPAATKSKPKAAPPVSPTSPLTGADVTAEAAKRPVTGVMIENSTFARPQSGLNQAGVVFEAIAEYGITRFLALYQETQPENLGPIRSVRPYYVDWTKSFDAPIAHVGGSPDALAKIKSENVKDLDQFFNAGAYRRINSREAPHNVYSTMKQLNEVSTNKGWTSSKFTSLARKKAAPAAQAARTATNINIAISGPTYDVAYTYDPASNRYLRSMGGAPHIDADSQERLSPSVVIGLVTPYGLEADGLHSKYQVTGTGIATVFQDGVATLVNWSKPTATDQYTFADPAGKPFKLNPGQTWFTVVASADAVTYTP